MHKVPRFVSAFLLVLVVGNLSTPAQQCANDLNQRLLGTVRPSADGKIHIPYQFVKREAS